MGRFVYNIYMTLKLKKKRKKEKPSMRLIENENGSWSPPKYSANFLLIFPLLSHFFSQRIYTLKSHTLYPRNISGGKPFFFISIAKINEYKIQGRSFWFVVDRWSWSREVYVWRLYVGVSSSIVPRRICGARISVLKGLVVLKISCRHSIEVVSVNCPSYRFDHGWLKWWSYSCFWSSYFSVEVTLNLLFLIMHHTNT